MENGLLKCSLFRGMGQKEVGKISRQYGFENVSYPTGEIFAIKGARYSALMILTRGNIRAETTDRKDSTLKIERISAPSLITPSLLYSENAALPFNLTAKSPSTVVYIPKEQFTRLLMDERQVLENFLAVVSSPSRLASDHISYFAYKTIKGKLANYLLDVAKRSGSNVFTNPATQQQMADIFGVARPSLARAISEMAAEGTIYVKGKKTEILFPDKLEQYAKN
ncbi:MAG: Crp/Fnr family transcriptional regulator [Rikenellaceae bacterium]|nr:Crp/Fnr family transcriptional regulator [Rikenellaceae bacterium]